MSQVSAHGLRRMATSHDRERRTSDSISGMRSTRQSARSRMALAAPFGTIPVALICWMFAGGESHATHDNVDMPVRKLKASFIESLLLRKEKLAEGHEWLYEIKLDGYRAIAIRSGGRVQSRSRNDNDFGGRHLSIAKDSNLCQMRLCLMVRSWLWLNLGSPHSTFSRITSLRRDLCSTTPWIFSSRMGAHLMGETLTMRRALLEKRVLPRLADRIRYSRELQASLSESVHSVKAQGLEGLVAKRRDSRYEPGQ